LHSWSGAASVPQSPSSLPVQQVAAQLAGVLVETSDKATELALAPEELGRVRLRLEADAANPDRLVILISVERPETLDLFRRHAGDLAAAIKAAGYSGADIGFGQDSQGRSPDRRHEPNALGPGRSRDEQTPISPTRRDAVGATLDLRL
ncbi:MAG: flagellar hook-length control protein FliK, partial [Tabrizicola sp.]|nr:flagellar hook-length control protein FliK [Tabrizicola sp.]